MSGFAEGLALGRAANLPLDSLLQVHFYFIFLCCNCINLAHKVLDLGAMSNPMFRGKGPGMIAGNFPTNFPLKHQQKDMK